VWKEWHVGPGTESSDGPWPLNRHYVNRTREKGLQGVAQLFGHKDHPDSAAAKRKFYDTRYHILAAIAEEAGLDMECLYELQPPLVPTMAAKVNGAVQVVQLAYEKYGKAIRPFCEWLKKRHAAEKQRYSIRDTAYS
jgi:hypothetical protein